MLRSGAGVLVISAYAASARVEQFTLKNEFRYSYYIYFLVAELRYCIATSDEETCVN